MDILFLHYMIFPIKVFWYWRKYSSFILLTNNCNNDNVCSWSVEDSLQNKSVPDNTIFSNFKIIHCSTHFILYYFLNKYFISYPLSFFNQYIYGYCLVWHSLIFCANSCDLKCLNRKQIVLNTSTQKITLFAYLVS